MKLREKGGKRRRGHPSFCLLASSPYLLPLSHVSNTFLRLVQQRVTVPASLRNCSIDVPLHFRLLDEPGRKWRDGRSSKLELVTSLDLAAIIIHPLSSQLNPPHYPTLLFTMSAQKSILIVLTSCDKLLSARLSLPLLLLALCLSLLSISLTFSSGFRL